MSFAGFSFICWRLWQIVTLIPTMGMLSWFVHISDSANQRTPNPILILFIVSVLAVAWTIGTLFLYSRAKHSASFVAFVDLLFVGAFIGAVYELRFIAKADCSTWRAYGTYTADAGWFSLTTKKFHLDTDKPCAMLKACFAFGIMNCLFFFLTFLFALLVHRHDSHERVVVKTHTTRRRSHHSHRSRSPRHSHHSRRSYV